MVDTHGSYFSYFKILFNLFIASFQSKSIIVMPAQNGLKIIVPLLVIFNKLFNRKLMYIVIGGCLPSFLNDNKRLIKYVKKLNYIFVETKTMKDKLKVLGLMNTIILKNMKELTPVSEGELNDIPNLMPYKICTFSRVMREK